jgi:hypothetical protein
MLDVRQTGRSPVVDGGAQVVVGLGTAELVVEIAVLDVVGGAREVVGLADDDAPATR